MKTTDGSGQQTSTGPAILIAGGTGNTKTLAVRAWQRRQCHGSSVESQAAPYSARQKVSERQADVACGQQERAMEMGFLAAAAGLDEDRTQVLFMTLQLYWQRNGPSMREACYEAGCMWNRSHGLSPRARSPLSYRQVAARFKRLDQVMLRSMRA
jgi:hypothetical protein